MSTPDKPDHARGWLYVEKLLDEQEPAHAAEGGSEPEKEWSVEEIFARAEALAAKEAKESPANVREARGDPPDLPAEPTPEPPTPKAQPLATVVPLRRPARIAWLLVAALTVATLLALSGPTIVGRYHDERGTNPGDDQAPGPTGREAADRLRDEALESCEKATWIACKDKLDEAARLDPAGESEPRVRKARADLDGATHPGPTAPKTPGP